MKTNCKEVRTKVKQYIVDHIADDETAESVYRSFSEWAENDNYANAMPENEVFQRWCQCLPSEVTFDYTNYDIKETLKSWLNQTEAEAEKYDIFKQQHLFYYLIFAEFKKMLAK